MSPLMPMRSTENSSPAKVAVTALSRVEEPRLMLVIRFIRVGSLLLFWHGICYDRELSGHYSR